MTLDYVLFALNNSSWLNCVMVINLTYLACSLQGHCCLLIILLVLMSVHFIDNFSSVFWFHGDDLRLNVGGIMNTLMGNVLRSVSYLLMASHGVILSRIVLNDCRLRLQILMSGSLVVIRAVLSLSSGLGIIDGFRVIGGIEVHVLI